MTDLKAVQRDRAGLTRSQILVFYHFRPGCARLSFYARGGIDIIVRTSTAAVFGYFLSANYRLEAAPGEDDPDNSLQVVTTAGIGLFCLLTLLVFRAAALLDPGLAASDSATATLAQFRDFVSGCVGCLIAGPAAKTESKPAIT